MDAGAAAGRGLRRPELVGVLNVTPDSFSDGGRFLDPARAAEHAARLVDEGAAWIDVGGESTRPGSHPVPAGEQLARILPVIRRIAAELRVIVSVDTTLPEVAERALDAGATVVNDVSGLADRRLLDLVARHRATLVVMHTRGAPATMQADTGYADLVAEVTAFLAERVRWAREAGVGEVVVDPGLGFAKAPLDNPGLIRAIPTFRALGPVLVGASRKRFVGLLAGVERPEDRVHASVGAALAASLHGVDYLRVHDVRATREALATFLACAG